jgi:hypothetical protein
MAVERRVSLARESRLAKIRKKPSAWDAVIVAPEHRAR